MEKSKVIRSTRKSISLRILEDGMLEVRAPRLMTDTQIESFINKHQDWIKKHQSEMLKGLEKKEDFKVTFHEEFLMMGKYYPLYPVDKRGIGFTKDGFYAYKDYPQELLKPEMIKLYRDLAKKILTKKVQKIAKYMEVYPKAVKVNKARTRWGSCSSLGNLNFSWYLIMAEESAIDYVVIHELAHFYEMNHSPKFWAVVEQFCPNYRIEKEKLQKLQSILLTQQWK